MEASKRKRSKAFMRKNLISLFLAAVLAAGSINPASVCAAEITKQETVTAEETEAQETSAEESAEDKTEDSEENKTEETKADVSEKIEEDNIKESEESSTEEPAEDGAGNTTVEQTEESALEITEEPAQETEEAVTEDSASVPAAEETPAVGVKDDEPLLDVVVTVEGTEEVVLPSDTGAPSSDELFAEFVERSFEGQPLSKASRKLRSAVSSLQGYDRAIYNYIAGQLPQIASGEQASTVFEITPEIMGLEKNSWTAEELGVDAVIAKDENEELYVPTDAQNAANEKVFINLSRIIDVLLAEHPYELYWYDKTAGTIQQPFRLKASYDSSLRTYVLSTTDCMYLRFSVAEEYSAGDYLVDTSIGQSVQSAVDNANAIVSEYGSASDEEKLRGYKNEICGLVSYNSSVAGGTSYGNPWQMIWVFDGDPGTNVVCEGYAKAFKYLCDHTVFDSSIECILAGGDLVRGSKSEPHMWNVLKMDDGNNYLVDVTNCDSGTAGYPDKLFLAGTVRTQTDSNGNTGYYFDDARLTYYYDNDTKGIFSEADLGIFLHDYGKHELGTDCIIEVEPTCTEAGSGSGQCAVCGDAFTGAIPATGHNYSGWNQTKKETCTEAGSQEKVCANCGDVITQTIPATGHKYGSWKVTRKATGTVTGIREKVCANCGAKITEKIPVLSGTWKKDSTGWWYQWSDRSYPVKMFLKISGKTYYFNASGYMVTGWQYIGGKWYYFDGSGAMVTGWQYLGDKWYYMNSSGVMLTGKQYIGGKWYYFNGSGAMVTGWQYIGGKWYYFNGSGAMVTGWQYIGGKWYYMNSSGVMLTGWQYLGGKWYYLNGSGAMVTGWQYLGGKWYYMNGSGAMVTGWQYLGGKWYYMNSSGAMVTGWQTINGVRYYFDASGAMQ